ncbi:hypothetical protein THAOC_06617 [Thalassiosira oceanica]|uniref:Uncharacterized protein n=1 Tax=Thalassiosira oceanica TaxID=159749 RepID=K0T432_THAOC|nr:hypothetical protein THAOC_06617 [Thalassiosira oceanica]|eukprot:EJK71899.1 hypothetical protein THAOC_06617 [Thalassiosira oceanica]
MADDRSSKRPRTTSGASEESACGDESETHALRSENARLRETSSSGPMPRSHVSASSSSGFREATQHCPMTRPRRLSISLDSTQVLPHILCPSLEHPSSYTQPDADVQSLRVAAARDWAGFVFGRGGCATGCMLREE